MLLIVPHEGKFGSAAVTFVQCFPPSRVISAAALRPTTSPGMTYTARFTSLVLTNDGTLRAAAGPTETTSFTAVVVWAAGRGRMDMVDGNQPGFFDPGDYYLFDSTEVIVVHPASKTFSRVPMEAAASRPLPLQFTNVNGSLDSLGPGDVLGSYQTQHYRVTTTASLAALGADRQTTMDYWLADIPDFPPSPLWTLVANRVLETDGMSKEASERIAPFKTDRPMGRVPLKTRVSMRVTSVSRGLSGTDRVQEISGIKRMEVDLAQLVLAEGMTEAPQPGMEALFAAEVLRTKDGGARWRVAPGGAGRR